MTLTELPNRDRASRLQQERIARRFQSLRQERGLTQDALAAAMGFKDRQTIAQIESGERRLQADELVRAAQALTVELDTFLDPFRLVAEGKFSFRASSDLDRSIIDEFERTAGRWIATYRELGRRAGEATRFLSRKLELNARSSFEEAQEAAEALVLDWNLGEVPADRLEGAITSQLGVLVLYVDAPKGLSGAAASLPGLQTILVNRLESLGRRNFDLAHELFHVLTWDAMPPDRVEPIVPSKKKGNRVEQLAENFAAALLMPSAVIASRAAARGAMTLSEWLRDTAEALRVSAAALKWRLVNLGLLVKGEPIHDEVVNRLTPESATPPPFSAVFIGRLRDAVEAGRLSFRRAASLLGYTPADFAEVCRSYGIALSYDAGHA